MTMTFTPLKIIGKWSLRFKITLLTTLLTAFLTISFTSYFVIHERNSQITQLRNKGKLLATILSNSIEIPLYAGNMEEVAMSTSQIFSNGDICNIRIYNSKQEKVLYAAKSHINSDCTGLTVRKWLVSNSGALSPEALLLGESSSDQLSGIIEMEMETGKLKSVTRKLILISTLLAFVFWSLSTCITILLLQRLTKTFQLLMAGVKKIEEGDLSTTPHTDTTDEPGRAMAAINSLAEALKKRNEENLRLQEEVVQGLCLQIDEEKNRHMAKLIQTNRMTSLGLLVSSMAHEINNPNGAIRLAAEILERGWKDVQPVLDEVARIEGEFKLCGLPYSEAIEDIEKAVEAITRSSIRIESVVHNLRSYSLGDREKQLMDFDLNRVAENSVAIVLAHGKMGGMIINTAFAPELPCATGNPFQLEQVVINLLMNAIQAMSINDGKTITLATETDPQSGELLLTVTDSGPGIAEENLPHVFEPFFSTRIDKGGSGLGLYIAEFIIKEQNGSLEVMNNKGGGCKAVIRMPPAKAVRVKSSVTTPASC